MQSSTKVPACPIDFVIQIVGNKWALSIIRDLCHGTKRTSELLVSLKGISPRTLSDRLRNLEKCGIIVRKVFPEIPPRVEYSLTEKGRHLGPVICEIRELGQRWQKELKTTDKLEGKDLCPHCQIKPGPEGCVLADNLPTESSQISKN